MEPVEKQPLAPKERERAPGEDRLIMLCDGVFAIAMTLLVLDIKLPANASKDIFDAALGSLRQDVLGYLITFYVLASYWLAHRHLMQDVRRIDGPFIWLTFLFLAFVAFFPAVSPALWQDGDLPEAFAVYTLVLSGCGFSSLLLRLYASWNHRLIDAIMSLETILYQIALSAIAPVVFCLSLLLLLFQPFASHPTNICFFWLLIAILPGIVRRIQTRRQKRRAAGQEQEQKQEPAPAR